MKRKIQAVLLGLCTTVAFGVSDASAHTFYMGDLNALTGKIVPEIDDNPGLYPEATPITNTTPGEFAWDLGGNTANAIVIVSTDHLTGDRFAFDVWGSSDLKNWGEATLSGVNPSDDADDFATRWHFDGGIRYLGINSYGNMILSQSDADGALIDSKAEIDGVARVFEPSSLLLAGAGALGTILVRRRKKNL